MKSKKPKVSEEEQERNDLLTRLNRTRVTADEIIRVVERCAERSSGSDWQPGDGMFVIVAMFRKNFEKSQAVFFRMEALARLLQQKALPGWALDPLKDGAIPVQEAVLRAAAVEPLVMQGNKIQFNVTTFLERCLHLADTAGEVQ